MKILTELQNKVYLSIIQNPNQKSNMGQIAQNTGMHRQSVKICLEALEKKGFIEKFNTIINTKNKNKSEKNKNNYYYQTKNINEIKNKILKDIQKIENEVPALSQEYESTKDSQKINTLYGTLGLRTVLLDEIIKEKEICAYDVSEQNEEFNKEYKKNDERREKLGIRLRYLRNTEKKDNKNNNINNQNIKIKEHINKPLSTYKKTNIQSKISIFIYANKVTFVYNIGKGIIFTSKINEVTKFFSDTFENRWKKA
jgi:predicted transcriptional regulator